VLDDGAAPADFEQRFEKAFGRKPSAGADRGYRAMQGIIAAIGDARAGNDRTSVIDAYFA
jgi:hypothetical protein